uniref:Thiaminase-2/PQQC domain-containing protein n=1 Tax=Paramormyrops kingsleyae TaxID=1676925 RepID=A0A3B3SMW0_9TELE
MLQKISKKEGMPQDLRLFFEHHFMSYQEYTNSLFNNYTLDNQTVIHPRLAIVSYVNTYHDVMEEYEPIYFAVALLPCARLWAYLGQNLNITQNNAYYSFKNDNKGYDPSKSFKPLLDEYQSKIDEKQANLIFRKQMENEKSFFKSSMP